MNTTEAILKLTLEMISLLTGENYKVVKKPSGEPLIPSTCLHRSSPIKIPPYCRVTAELNIGEKVLEVVTKITELLTREVPIRCQDVTVYLSMEEWEYLEGHKDLYKDVMMEDEPDGSRKRNPPQRCPRPLEDLPIPRQDQGEDPNYMTVTVKEEFSRNISSDGRYFMDTSGRSLVLSRDNVEDEDITRHSPGVNPITHNRHQSRSPSETSMDPSNPEESSDQPQTVTPEAHLRSESAGRSRDSSCLATSSSRSHTVTSDSDRRSRSAERASEPSSKKESSLSHEETPAGNNLMSCLGCGKSFTVKSELLLHLRSHTRATYTCSKCGKAFNEKSELRTHHKIHTREDLQSQAGHNPMSCLGCGKSFTTRSDLLTHLRSHTSVTFTCSECGKSFTEKSELVTHQKIHNPYSCSECGKSFTLKGDFTRHQRVHTGERPFSCTECGKSFTQKANLVIHQRIHTGERPFSCTECGKCFTDKGKLTAHQKSHTGERPYSCSECGKRFVKKGELLKHQRTHTGERPYTCSGCGKCFALKGNLNTHQKTHCR